MVAWPRKEGDAAPCKGLNRLPELHPSRRDMQHGCFGEEEEFGGEACGRSHPEELEGPRPEDQVLERRGCPGRGHVLHEDSEGREGVFGAQEGCEISFGASKLGCRSHSSSVLG